MLTLPSSVRIYVASDATDLRRGFDGLSALTCSVIGVAPMSGHLFVFLNRRRNRIKILVWDRTGFLLLYKQLERGTFRIASSPGAARPQAIARRQITE
jgi:transposase